MTYEMINRTVEYDISFDVMDAAIHRCLGKNVRGFIDFEREAPTHATVIYKLYQYQLGNIGRIRIDKLGNERVILTFYQSLEALTSKQKEEYITDPDKKKQRLAQSIINGLGKDKSFVESRKKHFLDVLDSLFYRLGDESIWGTDSTDDGYKGNTININIDGNVTNSNIVAGDNNEANID